MINDDKITELVDALNICQSFKLGTYTLSSGKSSSNYLDLRLIQSYPEYYKIIIDYDVKDKQVTNVEFSTRLPSTLQRAMIKYLNSFQMYGDTTGCSLSIKILEN